MAVSRAAGVKPSIGWIWRIVYCHGTGGSNLTDEVLPFQNRGPNGISTEKSWRSAARPKCGAQRYDYEARSSWRAF
jgi:hypothetical protein